MKNKYELDNLPAKVGPIFDAVIELIVDGMDINSMKVIDISNKAGIGKGTVYEYFDTKEEVITQAMFYHLHKRIDVLNKDIDNCKSFKNMIYTTLYWLDENMDFYFVAKWALGIIFENCEINKSFKEDEKVNGCHENCKTYLNDIYKKIFSKGVEEGTIGKDISKEIASMDIASLFIGYVIYQAKNGKCNSDILSFYKDHLYKNVCVILKP